MELKIYSGNGTLKLSVEPRDNSTQVEEIQAGNVLSLSFTLPRRVSLDVNDYANFLGHRYWLTEKYRPIQKSTVEWEYSFKLYGLENLISRFLVINSTDGGNEPVFTLTAPPREHVALIVKSINAGFGTNDWKVGTVEGNDNIVVEYHGKYCDEGLKAVADATGTEYWIEGTTVNLCRCEHGERVILGYRNGLTKIQPDVADNAKVYTRLFPIGSSKNIDPAKYGHSRLQLPGGVQYVDVNTDKYGIIHHYEENAFADIFPRYTGTVSNVRSEERTNEEGDKYSVYYFKDDNLPFDPNNYDLGLLVKRVTFQQGSELAGLGNDDNGTHYFEFNFDSGTREFEIIPLFTDSGHLPGGVLIPKPGDLYIPWNMLMPDEYYSIAEDEFLAAVHEYNRRHCVDVSCFKASTDYIEIDKRKLELHVGQRVRLESPDYFPETGYKDSRITKITRKVNRPSQMDLEISDALSTGAIDKIKGDIDEVKAYVQLSRGNLPDIIKVGDCTPFTDNNILSARRTKTDFMSRRHDDRSAGRIASDKALEVGDFRSGASGAMLFKDALSGHTVLELDKLYVRLKAYFETLEIVHVNSVGGKQIITPGGGIRLNRVATKGLVEVEVEKTRPKVDAEGNPVLDDEGNPVMETYTETQLVDNGVPEGVYRCWFLAEQDGETIENRFAVGDQAYSKTFNAKEGVSNKVSNNYYWRLVTGVGDDYIDLSMTDCDTGSDAPVAGDVVAHLGNRNDVDRQNALVFSAVDTFSPSITLYQGIDSYSYVGKDVVGYGVDKTTGKAFFRVYGDGYIGARDGSSFLQFIEGEGAQFKGKLSVGTTIGDGSTIESALQKATQSAIDTANENIGTFVTAVTAQIDELGKQIDRQIQTWFDTGIPTLDNHPAENWTTDEDKEKHLGDLYFDNLTGLAYRFSKNDSGNYFWNDKVDSAIAKALADAAKAQDTADGKRRVFVSQPTDADEYDVGDLWVNANYPADASVYSNEILRSVSHKAANAPFTINHWTKSSKYTDDTRAEQVQQNVDNLATEVNAVHSTVNDMHDFTDEAFKDGIVDRAEAAKIEGYINAVQSIKAQADNAYSPVYDNALLAGVAKAELAEAMTAFTLSCTELISTVNTSVADGIVTAIERAAVDGKYTAFNTKYGDFTARLAVANAYIQDKINSTVNDALRQIGSYSYLKNALKENTSIEGGLIQSSVLALGYTDAQGAHHIMAGSSGIYESSQLGGGIAFWAGGPRIDKFVDTTATDAASFVVRHDGSGYAAKGAIRFNADGTVEADPLSFFVGESTVGGLLASLQVVMAGDKPDYIIPKVPFQSLTVANGIRIGDGWLKYDAAKKAVYVEGLDGAAIGFYSKGWLSFRGANDGSGGSAVAGAANLSDLKDVSLGSLVAGQALVWNGAKWVNSTIATSGLDELSLANYLSSHGYATQSWANGVFVSKSGDTMTGHLTLLAHDMYLKNSTDGSQYVCYGFKNTANAIIAQIGYHNTGKRVIINPVGSSEPWVDAVGKYNLIIGNNELKYNTHSLLHTGNYTATLDDRYLKLTGGTVTGLLKISFAASTPFIVNNPVVNKECGIAFNLSNTGKGWVGYNPTLGAVLYNYANGKYLGIKDDGTPHYQGYTLWHSGNDGHNSGLDADTVDGVQCSDMLHFVALQPQNLDANSIVTTGSCYVPRGDMNNSSWNGYTFTNFPTSKPQGGFMLMNLAEGNYRRQLYTAYNNSNLYVRYYYFNGTAVTWSPWRTLAFTDSTVANANSLGGKAAAQYVTTDTAQEITGIKTFTNYTKIEQALMFKGAPDGVYFATSANGNLNISAHTNYSYVKNIGYITPSGSLTMGSFIKSGGTAAQFLKADGSVDSRAFLVLDGQQESTGPSLDLNAFNTAVFTRIRTGEQTTTNCPFAGYGQLLNLWTTGKVSALQIATKSSDIYFRSKDGAAATITSNWHRILHSGNYSSILDDRYVNASGDTMTGPLAVREIDAPDGNGLLAYSGSWTGVDFSSQYGVGTINKQGVIRSGNASLIHYRHGAGNATIWDSLNDGHGSGLNADMLDGLHLDSVRGYRVEHPAINSSLAVGNVPFNALGMQHGTPIYNDPEFASGNNGVAVYNNAANGNVTITRIADNQASANSSGYILQIKVTGPAEPWTGGFVQSIQSRANAVFMQIFRAKIPVGYNVNVNSNQMGANYSDVWITSTAGTGKWEWYARVVYCGASGSFSLGGYVSLKGANATAANPLYWYLSHCQVWDLSKNNYGTLRAKFADALSASRSIWGQSFDGSGNVSGNMTGVGTITSTYYSLHNISNNPYLKFNVDGKITYVQALSTGIGVGPTYTALFVTNDSKVGIGTASPSEKLSVAGWVGTIGDTGWYNITHGGGWYMSDSGWVRTYNNKGIYSGTGEIRNNSYFNRTVYEGSSWNNGYGAYNVGIISNSSQTPLMVAYRNGYAVDVTGANRLFALELLNNGAEMHFAFGGSTKFSMTSAGVFFADGGLWTNGFLSFKGKNTSSDARLKRHIRDIHVPLAVIAKAPNIIYAWRDDGSLDMGSIAQYWQKHLPLSVRLCQNGYLGMDYSKVALACVISMASELLGVKDDVSVLKRELRQLKHENQQLKQQIDRMERRIA